MSRLAGAAGGSSDRRLGENVAELDAARFVGRVDLLTSIEAMLDGTDSRQILFVHGPGGAGKSALLREVARRSRRRRRRVLTIDGRLLEVSKEALAQACSSAANTSDWVILIDSFEQIQALAAVLRDEILPSLSSETVVIIAGRRRPGGLWFRDGWEHLAQDVALRPLRDEESEQFLAQSAITGEAATRIRRWAKGSPLALQIAASAPPDAELSDVSDLAETIVARLVGDELEELDAELLELAALARAVDERLIAEVLPHRDPVLSYRQLRSMSLTEPYGNRLALHDLVRDAVRADLVRRAPHTARRLTCLTAEHLCGRVVAGEFDRFSEIAELLASPFLRKAYSSGQGGDYRGGQPEPGDAAEIATKLNAAGSQWWGRIERYFADAPHLVNVVKDSDGKAVGLGIAMMVGAAPEWILEDPVVSALHDLGRRRVGVATVPIWRDCLNLVPTDDPSRAEVFGLMNHPPHLSVDLVRSRAVVGAVEMNDLHGWVLRTSVQAERINGFEILDGERRLGAYIIDNGPALLIGNIRRQVYEGQKLVPPELISPVGQTTAVIMEALRSALTDFHDSVALADNPLAEGVGIEPRAESIRGRIRAALDAAYGPASERNELRQAIERGYLDPDGSHERAMAELHVSRSTYFRTLKKARAQLAAAMANR